MKPHRKRRLILIVAGIAGVAIAVGLLLLALRENINLFYNPSQVANGEAPANRTFRLGGLVVDGSVKRGSDLDVEFAVTDTAKSVVVHYSGILPDLFREGQGIIALGKLGENRVFKAEQVLAKHDENYMPPEVSDAIKAAHQQTATE